MPKIECLNGSPCDSASAKTQETRAATIVSISETIIDRTLAHAPQNDALLHGRVRPCRSCGCETSNDRYCTACGEALREERAEELKGLCCRHGCQHVEGLPADALPVHQDAWRRS